MNLKKISLMTALASLIGMGACVEQTKEVQNDSNTPLHLLQPAYNTPYGPLTTEEIKEDLDRVLHYLEKSTPTRVVSKTTGEEITDYAAITTDAQLERGAYRLASYEWGVTYSAMLTAAEATGDEAYYNYVADRFKFLAAVAPHFRALLDKGEKIDPQMRQILTPHALDDAGAVCAAMVKAQLAEPSLELNALIDNYMDFILNKVYLANVAGDKSYLADVADPASWYNQMVWTSAPEVDAMVYEDLGNLNIKTTKEYKKKHHFYCYPNPHTTDTFTSDVWSPRPTRLVVEATLGNVQYYYPVALPELKQNTRYYVSLHIIRPGATSPEQDMDKYAVSFKITIEEWKGPENVSETI